MTAETWLSLAAIIVSVISIVVSAIVGFKTSKLNNLKDIHEYERDITYFELTYKDEKWLFDLMQSGEFSKYNSRSRKRILKWWEKYKKSHIVLLMEEQVEFSKNQMLRSMYMGPEMLKNKKDKDIKDDSDGSLDF